MVNPDSKRERIDSFATPRFIEFGHFVPHPERRAHCGFCIFGRPTTAHVSPNGHDCVANKLIERAAVIENRRHHRAEITVELRHERSRVRALR